MKESAMLALEYIHSHAGLFDINEEMFENWNVHVHVPRRSYSERWSECRYYDGYFAGVCLSRNVKYAVTWL